MGVLGNGRMTLAADGANRWKYSLGVTAPLADVRQTTVFEENGGQWRPLSGTDSSKVLAKGKTKNATYDWSSRRRQLDRRRQARARRPDQAADRRPRRAADQPGGRARPRRRQADELPHGRGRPRAGSSTTPSPARNRSPSTASRAGHQGRRQPRREADHRLDRRWHAGTGAHPAARQGPGRDRPARAVGALMPSTRCTPGATAAYAHNEDQAVQLSPPDGDRVDFGTETDERAKGNVRWIPAFAGMTFPATKPAQCPSVVRRPGDCGAAGHGWPAPRIRTGCRA